MSTAVESELFFRTLWNLETDAPGCADRAIGISETTFLIMQLEGHVLLYDAAAQNLA